MLNIPIPEKTQPPSFLVPQEYLGDPSFLNKIAPGLKHKEKQVSHRGSSESVYRDGEGDSASFFGMNPGLRIVAGIRLSHSLKSTGEPYPGRLLNAQTNPSQEILQLSP